MTDTAASRLRGRPMPAMRSSDTLTQVELIWVEKKIETWIRFGRAAHEQVLDRYRRVLSFRPGNAFAVVRWAANDFGTIISRIDIVRAVEAGEPYQTLPFVRPGGDSLLKISGWSKVEQVLCHIDAVEEAGIDACDVAPDHWRHVHNRLSAGHTPRAYTAERHRAWLKRQEITLEPRSKPDAPQTSPQGQTK